MKSTKLPMGEIKNCADCKHSRIGIDFISCDLQFFDSEWFEINPSHSEWGNYRMYSVLNYIKHPNCKL